MPVLDIDGKVFTQTQRLPYGLDRVLLGGACLTLAFGVVAMGAVQPWAEFVLRSASAALLVLWVAGQLFQDKLRLAGVPVCLPVLTFAALVFVQMLFGITAYRHDTLVELLNYGCYGMLAFVMLQSVKDSDDTRLLAFCFTGFGLIVAMFGLLQYFTFNGKLFWLVEIPTNAAAFGPYVNHNHYAGLMEMLIAFPLVFALQNRLSVATRLFFGFSAIVMGASVVESGSRGGTIALLCQIVLLGLIGRFTKMKRGSAILLLGILAAMAILLAVVADNGVVARVSSLREPGRTDVTGWRMQLNRDSLAMVRSRPIVGWGLGTFPTVYPQFRSFYDDAPIIQAHDDYMQLLVETGLVGGVIVAWFLVVVFREGWRNLGQSPGMWEKGVTMAAIVSVSGILIHSASDFNLHIPANAAIFFVMCALVVAPVSRSGRSSDSDVQGGTMVDHAKVRPLAEVEEFPQKLRVVVRRY